ncbi:MAG: UDP-N-acetylmuramate dehydrogenase [bacterium]|nr:UDP-N-acetylmuramate dehydrogenase [bacterium]
MVMFRNLEILENVNLGEMTTMRLGGGARFLAKVNNLAQAQQALDFAQNQHLPLFILGGGSNTIVRDEGFQGVVIKNEILGREVIDEDEGSVIFRLGSGENWDDFCQWAVREKGLSGCEAMALIPGTVGALPVQNVGAYGQETVAIFEGCEALNLETGEMEEFSKEDCQLGYRTSIFRTTAFGKYFITAVKLKLSKKQQKIPLYFSVAEYFAQKNINPETATPLDIMRAVIYLRKEKLPEPREIPSAGSFFKNVELSKNEANDFRKRFPEAPIFEESEKWKIPTGWLIDNAGLRGKIIHGMRPHDKNALILTNISAQNYQDLARARAEIQQAVKDKFGFEIEQEPLEI